VYGDVGHDVLPFEKYLVIEIANDRGYSTQIDLYTPDFSGKVGLSDKFRARLLAFYDYGAVQRNDPLPGEVNHAVLASIGVGARLNYGKPFSLRVDVAELLKQTPNSDKGSVSVSAALVIFL